MNSQELECKVPIEKVSQNESFMSRILENEIHVYRDIIDVVKDAVFIFIENTLFYANSQALQFVNVKSVQELWGKTVVDVITTSEEYKNKLEQHIANIMTQGQGWKYSEQVLLRNDGNLIDCLIASIIVENNGIVNLVVSLHDITVRKDLERKLLTSQTMNTAVFDYLPDGILIHDGERLVYVNKTCAKMLGYSRAEELIGKEITAIIHPSDHSTSTNRLTQLQKVADTLSPMHYRYMKKDGSIQDVEVTSVYIDIEGEKAILTTVRDISERIIMEEQRRLLEEARKFNEIRTEFFGNLSHELKTPLNIILSIQQLLSLYLQNQESLTCDNLYKAQGHLLTLKQNCFRLLRLVNNIIDVTKIDSGYMDLNLENVDIVSVLEEITLSVADYIESHGIGLIFDTEVEEKIIACDVDKIERIMLNLLSNAIKYTDAGGVITVSIFEEDESIRISVKDTGIGIPSERISYIFERFTRIEQSFERIREGSGIGLTLVKSLVEMHGGAISVVSELNKGSEFIMLLPTRNTLRDLPGLQSSNDLDYNARIKSKIEAELSDIYLENDEVS